MILGTVTEKSARCVLCGWESAEKSDDGAETEMRKHLRMVHGRVLVSREDRAAKRFRKPVREFHGVYWKNEV